MSKPEEMPASSEDSNNDSLAKLEAIADSLTPEEQASLIDILQSKQDEKDSQRDVMAEADDAGEGKGNGYF